METTGTRFGKVSCILWACLISTQFSCYPPVGSDGTDAGQGIPEILPSVLRAVALTNTAVLVTFSDEMDDSAVALAYYRITGGNLRITAATLGTDRKSITLTTSSQEGVEYTLEIDSCLTLVGKLLDPEARTVTFFGIARGDTDGPRVVEAVSLGNGTVLVAFSEPVGPTAAYTTNYNITAQNGTEKMVVTAATLNASLTEVTLTTSSQKEVDYTLVVANVADLASNLIDALFNSATFTGTKAATATDTLEPRVVGAISTSNTAVLVTFSEAMGDSALNPASYSIVQTVTNPEAGGLIVISAQFLSGDRTAVELTTLRQSTVTYQVTVVNVKDLAGNPLAPKSLGLGYIVDPTSAIFAGTGPSTDGSQGAVDSDGDGLNDDVEQRGWAVTVVLHGGAVAKRDVTSDPYTKDTDGDGYDDLQEHRRVTDPRSPDTDGDTLNDADEWDIYYTSPTHADTDGDDLDDSGELFLYRTSPLREDSDGDGFHDSDELFEMNRDPRVADLPRPRIDVGDMALRLDTRFSYTDTQGTSKTKEESTSTQLTEGESTTYAFSDSQTNTNVVNIGAEFGVEKTFGLAENKGKVSFKASAGYSYTNEKTTSVSRESSQSAQQAYEDSLRTSETVDETQSVTRDVVDASMDVVVTVGNVSDIAFSVTNLEITAMQQDPVNRSRFLPVATLIPAATLSTGTIPKYNTGPFIPERGPFIFSSREIFPSLVEDLMKNPRGLIFKVANFDVEDEFGRNLAFISQAVNDRTAGLTIDYGNGQVDRYRVAIHGIVDEATGEFIGGFDDRGRQGGLPMWYVLQDILGMKKNGVPDAITVGEDGCAQTWASDDDVQIITPACPAITPGGIIIKAGPNGRLESTPRGDDQRVGDAVVDGGDGCAHTVAAGDDITFVQGACASSEDGIVVLAGPNGVIDSLTVGDDEIVASTGYETEIATQCDGDTLDVIIEPSVGGNGTVDTTATGDDVQEVAFGATVAPGTIVITAGANGVFETKAGGDDVRRGPGYFCSTGGECPNGQCTEVEIPTRFKGVKNNAEQARFWVLLTEADIEPGADFDKIILKAGDTLALAYVQDKDYDGLFAREEYIYGSSDRRINTDGCPDPADPTGPGFLCNDPSCNSFATDCLTDYEEVKVGWEVEVEGQPLHRSYADPVQPDSDADGVLDTDERVYGTDASKSDTDEDGISDGEEIYGYTIYKRDRETVVRHVDPWESLVIVDGGNGTVETTLAGDDVLVNAAPAAGDTIIVPGPNGVVESIPDGDDKLQPTQVIIDGGNGVVETSPVGDDTLASGAGDMLITVTFESFNAGDDDCDADDVVVGTCDANSTNSGDNCATDTDCLGEVGGICQADPAGGTCDADSANNGAACAGDADCTDQPGVCDIGNTDQCLAGSPAALVGIACTSDNDCSLVGSCDIPDICDAASQNAGTVCAADADCTPTPAACDLPAESVCSSDPYGEDGTSCTVATVAVDCPAGDTCVQKLTKYVGEYTLALEVIKTDATGGTETVLNQTPELLPINKGDGTVLLQIPADFPLQPGESFEVKATITELDVNPPDSAFEQNLPTNEVPAAWTISQTFQYANLSTNQVITRTLEKVLADPCGGTDCCMDDDTFVFIVNVGGTVRQGGVIVRPGPNGKLDTTPRGDDVKAVPHLSLFATDPLNRDTDGDSLPDGLERTLGANPNDLYDVGRFRDSDRDGLTDGEEKDGWFVGYTDASGTVFCRNGDDNFIVVPNAAVPPAACVINKSDPLEPDTDHDGLPDTLEMVLRTNPRSRDTDGDSLLDYDEFDAESEYSISYIAYRDFKDLCAPADRCIYDPVESKLYGTSPVKRDTDADGLADAEEIFGSWVVSPCNTTRPDTPPYIVYSDARQADADLDGWGDGMERQAGTDPNLADTDDDSVLDSTDQQPVACGKMVKITITSWYVGSDDCDGAGYGPGDFSYTFTIKRGNETMAGPFSASDIEIDEGGSYTLNHASAWFSLTTGQSVKVSAVLDESDPTNTTEPDTWSFERTLDYASTVANDNFQVNQTPGEKCWSDDIIYMKIEVIGG